MRPLKRPMFRTGGPIKEGVMNGLRDGGVATTMADATMMAGGGMPNKRGLVDGPGGYAGDKVGFFRKAFDPRKSAGSNLLRRGNALSNDIFALIMGAGMLPMKNGGVASLANRPGYSFGSKVLKKLGPVGTIYNKGIANIKKGFDTVKEKLGTTKTVTETVPKQGPYTAGGNIYSKGYPGGTKIGTGPGTVEVSKSIYQPGGFLSFLAKSPEAQLAKKLYEGKGIITKPLKAVVKGVGSSPTALIGLTYAGGKYLLPDGTEASPEQIEEAKKITGAGGAGTSTVKKTPAEIAAEKEIKDKQKLDRIYKLLGVDRAKRNAASKALIDMSRYIDEGGKDVISKKNIGSTISKGISAFDKRLDKVDQLKEAAGLMQAKAEIEAMSDPYSKEYKKQMTEKLKKENNPTARDYARAYIGKKTLSHPDTVTIGKSVSPNAVVLADAKKAKAEGIGEDITAEAYVKDQIKTQGGDVAGVYIVDKVIIQVDAQGNTTQLLP
jgi:hypothetical protein